MHHNPESIHLSPDFLDNILFDLGGVLVKIDFLRMAKAFEKIGLPHLDQLYSHQQQIDLFDQFDRGQISEDDFRRKLLSLHGLDHISNEQFDEAWNQIIVDTPEAVLKCLDWLRQHFNLFLLSNTNSIHIRYLNSYLQQKRGVDNFEAYFSRVYYSFKMGSRKPETKIFEHVLADSKIDPRRTLFIDDTQANVETAKQMGFQVFLMPLGKLLPDVIDCKAEMNR
jgi:putative hydrolase of the HAD superfamily